MELLERLIAARYVRADRAGAWRLIPFGHDLQDWEDGIWIRPDGRVELQRWNPNAREYLGEETLELVVQLNPRELAETLNRIPVWVDPMERLL